MKLVIWFLRTICIPAMQIVLLLALLFGAIEAWAYINPNKAWGYNSEDAAFDVLFMLVFLNTYDRFFGTYATTLRRMAKIIDRRYKEIKNG